MSRNGVDMMQSTGPFWFITPAIVDYEWDENKRGYLGQNDNMEPTTCSKPIHVASYLRSQLQSRGQNDGANMLRMRLHLKENCGIGCI